MSVYRIHIRPGAECGAHASFGYCLDEQVLGVGWQTYTDRPITTWAEYLQEAAAHHDDLSRVRYLHDYVHAGDLLWTRCPDGHYFLARVTGSWEYRDSARAAEADIVNVVPCRILKVRSIDEVPGKVIASFRPPRCIQAIDDGGVEEYSKALWNSLAGENAYTPERIAAEDIFSLLTAEQVEDLLFIYLQTRGWVVVPHSRKADTMAYEFFLIHRQTHERALVQAKTGHTWLAPADWSGSAERVFLFQSRGNYAGEAPPRVECLAPADLRDFMRRNRALLPASIAHWDELVSEQAA